MHLKLRVAVYNGTHTPAFVLFLALGVIFQGLSMMSSVDRPASLVGEALASSPGLDQTMAYLEEEDADPLDVNASDQGGAGDDLQSLLNDPDLNAELQALELEEQNV
eukprot:1160012-Pelagomonas_calceolata.AAC.1